VSPAMGAPFAVLGRVIPLLVVVLATIYGIVLALKYEDYGGAPAILALYGIALLPMGVNELIFSGLFQLLCGEAAPAEDDAPPAGDQEDEQVGHAAAAAPAAPAVDEAHQLHHDQQQVPEHMPSPLLVSSALHDDDDDHACYCRPRICGSPLDRYQPRCVTMITMNPRTSWTRNITTAMTVMNSMLIVATSTISDHFSRGSKSKHNQSSSSSSSSSGSSVLATGLATTGQRWCELYSQR